MLEFCSRTWLDFNGKWPGVKFSMAGIFQDCSGLVLPTSCVMRDSVALQGWNQWVPLGIPCRPAGWAGGAVSRLARPLRGYVGATQRKKPQAFLSVSLLFL